MKRLLIGVLAASAMAAALPASAAPWTPVNARQNQMFAKIQLGIRNGALTQGEAANLKNQFYSIARLETTYRRSGGRFTAAEQADLNRRLGALNQNIHTQKHDAQRRY